MLAVSCNHNPHQVVKKSHLVRIFRLFTAMPVRVSNSFYGSGAEFPAFQDLKISEKVGSAAILVGI